MGHPNEEPGRAISSTRRVVHDLRQPLAAMQVWVDLLFPAVQERLGEKEQRYLAKIRDEIARVNDLLVRASAAAAETPADDAPPSEPVREEPEAPGRLAGLALLVVEDDEVTAEALQIALEAEGASVALATTVEDALELFEAARPAAVLSDISVGKGDGFELIRELRRREPAGGTRTPAIAVTGFESEETRATAREAGFEDLVLKPFVLADLVELIARRVRRV